MTSFSALAEQLLVQAQKVDEALQQHGLAPTSFDKDTLESLPEDAQKLRWELLETSHTLRQLARGARLSGLDIAFGWTEQVVLRIIVRYKLASAVPIDGSATYQEISASSGLDPSLVARTIRAAMCWNIFDEAEPGRVRHTAISRLLATDEGYNSLVGLQVEDLTPASTKLIEAWETFGGDAGEPEQSAFSLENGGRPLFKTLAEEPERANRFNLAMKYSLEDKDFSAFDIVHAFDWSTLDKPGSRLIDLGGGYGHLCQELSKHTQNLAFTVHDLPHVVEHGRKILPSEFQDRVSFQVQSFLEPQNSEGHPPDAYLISRCLHNWSDDNCARILRCLIPALRKDSKVLIWDAVLSDPPVKLLSERFNFQQDFVMATVANGKDRSAKEFKQVLELADERFRFENIVRPPGCKLSMVEVSWTG